VLAFIDNALYLNWRTVDNAHVSRTDVMRAARDVLLATPQLHAARVYTRDELIAGGWERYDRASGRQTDSISPYRRYFDRAGAILSVWNLGHIALHPLGLRHARAGIFYGAGVKAASYAAISR